MKHYWNPMQERFSRVKKEKELEENCRALVSLYGQKISSSQDIYHVAVYFEGYILTVEFGYSTVIPSIPWHVKYPTSQVLDKCSGLDRIPMLDFCISSDMAGISQIYSNKDYADLPSKRRGTWLVQFLLTILDSLGTRTVQLCDVAGINKVSLLWLRVFTEKSGSWYRNFGFHSRDGEDSTKEEQQLRELPLENIRTLPKYPPYKEESLSEYMRRLFNIDPGAFNAQVSILMQLCISGRLMYSIRQANYAMIKSFEMT